MLHLHSAALPHHPLHVARDGFPDGPGEGLLFLIQSLSLQPLVEMEDKAPEAEDLLGVERTPSGRIRRTSAQVAVFHLQEIAEDELARDWTKRRMRDDLVPETARVSRQPGPL